MKNNYFDSNNKKDCNGCGVCSLKCPVGAIKMIEDYEGFYYPVIDKDKCISCDLCKRVCSNFNNSNFDNQEAYMVINNNICDLLNSTSGGIYIILAKYVISNNGIVFGVEYDKHLKVKHKKAITIDECKLFQGSKYVRSNLGNSYAEVKKYLDKGKMVLFVGTPCQCQGLNVYLNKNYENLILCDIICHANPSQKVFDLYIKSLENRYNKKVKTINFRSKEKGWRSSGTVITFEGGYKIEEATFYKAFSQELIDRPSCHSCVFSGQNRVTDITIGDFWGVEKLADKLDFNIKNGVNVVLLNTIKGKNIFNLCKNNFYAKKIELDKALKYNHNGNVPSHVNRKKFFANLERTDLIDNINKNLKVPIYIKIIKKIKKIWKE